MQMLELQFGTQHKLIGMMQILTGTKQVLLNSLIGQDLLSMTITNKSSKHNLLK